MVNKTAIIIGSGIAGMSLAEILSRNKYSVTILESQNKIGGEASLATQKWYHTGWLYAALINPSATLGCYKALHLFDKVYKDIFSNEILNLDIHKNGIKYNNTKNGWFINERIKYLYAMSTSELSLFIKLVWPIYLNMITFRRLRNYNYDFSIICNCSDDLKKLMNSWEGCDDGDKRYKIIESTDSKIETRNVIKSLVSKLSSNTEIITDAQFKLIECNGHTKIKIGNVVQSPDILILASGKSVPEHLSLINCSKIAKQIKSIKSPIVVLKNKLSYPDFIRYTPKVDHTINHITFNVGGDKQISTIGAHYSFPLSVEPNLDYYVTLMCEKMQIDTDQVMESYYGIKTELVGKADRRYNHALEKVNQNTFFALAGKFSQFPLLVYDFVKKTNLSFQSNVPKDYLKINDSLISHTYPAIIMNKNKEVDPKNWTVA